MIQQKLSTLVEDSGEFRSSSKSSSSQSSQDSNKKSAQKSGIDEPDRPADKPADDRPKRVPFALKVDSDFLAGDLSINPAFHHRASMNYRYSENFTIMLPNNEKDCIPTNSSTPDGKAPIVRDNIYQ